MTSTPSQQPAAAPAPIPDFIRETLDLQSENDEALVSLAGEENAVLVCAIAPYRSIRISPIEEVRASIGLHEEFAFEALIDEISSRQPGPEKMILLLNSPGGDMHASFKVARALRKAFRYIEVFSPHMAASGGTLIALIGDKIIMGSMSQLSPLDPQVLYKGRRISALTFRHAYNRICKMFEKKTKDEAPYPEQVLAQQLDPSIMEDWNAAVATAEIYATEILKLSQYPEEKAGQLAHSLIHHFTDHDSDINFDVAKELGIRVERNDATERNKKVWRYFRAWLGKYVFEESGTHQIRYVFPQKASGHEQGTA